MPFRSKSHTAWAAAALALLAWSAPVLAAENVDLELVLAVDTSGSVNYEEANLQRQGVADAFKSDELQKVIGLGVYGKIAVAYLDWSNQFENTVVIDWRIIDGKESAARFADDLVAAPSRSGRRTSISSAIVSSMELFDRSPYKGTRRTIDISGDGKNNFGLSLAPIREEAIAKGIVINGLPIMIEDWGRNTFPDIDTYYANCVIGGRGAFAVVAKGFQDFTRAVRRKLIMEISSIPTEVQFADASAVFRPANQLDFAQLTPPRELPPPPGTFRAPAVRETNCDVWNNGGFGGFGGGGFR
jgi:hypothetical protein